MESGLHHLSCLMRSLRKSEQGSVPRLGLTRWAGQQSERSGDNFGFQALKNTDKTRDIRVVPGRLSAAWKSPAVEMSPPLLRQNTRKSLKLESWRVRPKKRIVGKRKGKGLCCRMRGSSALFNRFSVQTREKLRSHHPIWVVLQRPLLGRRSSHEAPVSLNKNSSCAKVPPDRPELDELWLQMLDK